MKNEIESAGGLAAYSSTHSPTYLATPGQEVRVRLMLAGQQADYAPTLSHWRDAVWSEVHVTFDASTTVVDARCGGNPVGKRAP